MNKIRNSGLCLILLLLIFLLIYTLPIINIDISSNEFVSYSFLNYFLKFILKNNIFVDIVVFFFFMVYVASFMMNLVLLMRPEKKIMNVAIALVITTFVLQILSMILIGINIK